MSKRVDSTEVAFWKGFFGCLIACIVLAITINWEDSEADIRSGKYFMLDSDVFYCSKHPQRINEEEIAN